VRGGKPHVVESTFRTPGRANQRQTV